MYTGELSNMKETPLERQAQEIYFIILFYANLTDKEALQIGRSHNEMTGTNLPPKFRDDVTLARNLLLASGIAIDEMQNAAHNERFLTSLKQVFGVNVS